MKVANGFQTNIDMLKLCPPSTFYVSDFFKYLDFVVENPKCSILLFSSNRLPWDRLVSDLHKRL